MNHPLLSLMKARQNGKTKGIHSVCSANELVIEAAMDCASAMEEVVLIEATANQVNQYGGYTGMKPIDFVSFVMAIADKKNFPREQVVLGGDHLGPLVWCTETEEVAMLKSEELVREFVAAGFTKIHLDTSMRLADDDTNQALSDTTIAARGARLAAQCERAYQKRLALHPDALAPVYVIGSEVPIPGGSQDAEEGLAITDPDAFRATVQAFRTAFETKGLHTAWQRVMAVVVQPGVEFGDDSIHEYNRKAAAGLVHVLKEMPQLVFEGHSTDYQTPRALRQMVEDGIAILKVGPALTFALREALYDLSLMERELLEGRPDLQPSRFIEVLDAAMVKHPNNWQMHYHGTEDKLRLARKFSLSDRSRYYLPDPHVINAVHRLFSNLDYVGIPLSLLSQFMPIQYQKVRAKQMKQVASELVRDRVRQCIEEYQYATHAEMETIHCM